MAVRQKVEDHASGFRRSLLSDVMSALRNDVAAAADWHNPLHVRALPGATELTDVEKPALLRAYLKKWKFEVGVFFDGVSPDSSDQELRAIAPDHPVFRLSRT